MVYEIQSGFQYETRWRQDNDDVGKDEKTKNIFSFTGTLLEI